VIAWFADGLLKKDGRLAGHTQFEIAGYLANLICMPGVVWLLIRSTGY
jgi:hypothetical protein